MALRDIDDKTASRVGGDTLQIPDTNVRTRVVKYDNGFTTTASRWEEDCVVDDFTIKEDFHKAAQLDQEQGRIQLRISDRRPSKNTGKVRSDFGNWYWDIAGFTDEQLEEWASLNGDDPRQHYRGLMKNMQMSSRRYAQFIRALGHQDRLVNRTIFRGLKKIEDLAPTFSGRHVTMVIEQLEDKDGVMRENIQAYKKA